MKRLLLASSALPGLPVTIHASRGGVAVPAASVASWGTPPAPPPPDPPVGGDGGTITITLIRRTRLTVAPDTVGFTVDLSASTFDTPAPASATDYDRRFHELEYYWTFGDPGTWTAPADIPAAYQNRNYAYGANVRHCYRTPGAKTVTVMVVEPASGKVATATTTVTIADPDVVFAGDRTICINPVGDSDFSAKPTGAQTFNADSFITGSAVAAAVYAKSGGSAGQEQVRVLFKAGWSGLFRWDMGNLKNCTVGIYGGAEIADLTLDRSAPVGGGSYGLIFCTSYPTMVPGPDIPDFRFQNVRFRGDFDTETMSLFEQSNPASAINFQAARNLILVDCHFTNLQRVAGYQANPPIEGAIDHPIFHMDNCVVEKFTGVSGGDGYAFYLAVTRYTPTGSHIAFTGNRIVMDPNGLSEFDATRSLIRAMGHDTYHIRGNRMFNNGGTQSCIRLPDKDPDGVARITIHSNVIEATGITTMSLSGNNDGRPTGDTGTPTQLHMLLDSNVFIGGPATRDVVDVNCCGVTIRNNLFYVPEQSRYGNPLRCMVRVFNQGDQTYFADWPVRIYNNTMVSPRTSANWWPGVQRAVYLLASSGEKTAEQMGAVVANNVVHFPAAPTPETVFAPLTAVPLLAALNDGFRPNYHEIRTTLATAVPNGGSYTASYDGADAYLATDSTRHTLFIENGATIARAQFALTYGASLITVTNNTGSTWNAGWVMNLRVASAPGHYRAKQPAYASGAVPDSRLINAHPASGLIARFALGSTDARGPGTMKGAWNTAAA